MIKVNDLYKVIESKTKDVEMRMSQIGKEEIKDDNLFLNDFSFLSHSLVELNDAYDIVLKVELDDDFIKYLSVVESNKVTMLVESIIDYVCTYPCCLEGYFCDNLIKFLQKNME